MNDKIDLQWLQQKFPDVCSIEPIGRGGQKQVFSGCHTHDGEVVLKLFHLGIDEERVRREVQAVQNIPSARIPKIFEVGTTTSTLGDVIWVREQRIKGKSLREVLCSLDDLDNDSIIRLAIHMLEALFAAENVRIVHRDVKPDNIIAADDGSFWLLDFGLARHLDMDSLTATALAFGCGTPGYMPPEQFRNVKSQIDARADLFGLGVTLFECAEGFNPYRNGARDMLEIFKRVESQPLPRIKRRVDEKEQFQELILAMTRPQPNHRLRNVSEALEWINDISNSRNDI